MMFGLVDGASLCCKEPVASPDRIHLFTSLISSWIIECRLPFRLKFISTNPHDFRQNKHFELTSKLDRCTAHRTCVHTFSPAWDLSKSKGRWNISVCQEPQTKTRSCSLRVEAHLRLPPSCLCSNHDSGNLTQITSYCSAANHFQLQ